MIIVVPVNEVHDEESTCCDCCPTVEFVNEEMIIQHNSLYPPKNPVGISIKVVQEQ